MDLLVYLAILQWFVIHSKGFSRGKGRGEGWGLRTEGTIIALLPKFSTIEAFRFRADVLRVPYISTIQPHNGRTSIHVMAFLAKLALEVDGVHVSSRLATNRKGID